MLDPFSKIIPLMNLHLFNTLAARARSIFPGSRVFSVRGLVLFAVLFLLPSGHSQAAETKKPNVVIFLADDSGWGDYSFNGNTNLRTPNIDSLARAGAVLDRFYVCSVCAPTRAEFLTGRYHPRGGVRGVSTGQERLNTDEKTIADAFKAAFGIK